jgi:hypothetical protein
MCVHSVGGDEGEYVVVVAVLKIDAIHYRGKRHVERRIEGEAFLKMIAEVLVVVVVLALDENEAEVYYIVGSYGAYLVPSVVEMHHGIVDSRAGIQAV